jgi:2-polyprenyl-6-methoxyphenol hydroxylase-like FAD-dependent oxidoreductase
MLDAVSLANILYDIPTNTRKDIEAAFATYFKDRSAHGKAAVQGSRHMGRLSGGQKWTESLIRNMFLNIVPSKVQQSILDKMLWHRPQATFLPFVADRGEFKAKQQVQVPAEKMKSLSGLCLRLFQ